MTVGACLFAIFQEFGDIVHVVQNVLIILAYLLVHLCRFLIGLSILTGSCSLIVAEADLFGTVLVLLHQGDCSRFDWAVRREDPFWPSLMLVEIGWGISRDYARL